MKTRREYVKRLSRLVVSSLHRLAGDLTLVNGPAPVTPDDPTVQPRQGPSRYEPLIQERPPSSNKEPKSAFDPLHSRSSGSTSPTAVNVRSSRSCLRFSQLKIHLGTSPKCL